MTKIAQCDAFWKAQKKHKHLGFDGMVFLAYVAEFEAQKLRCFVSRAKIAEELPISESGARYLIKRLVKAGYLFVCYEGRKRYLSTTKQGGTIKPDQITEGANPAPKGGTIKPDEGAELNQIRGHERTTTKNQDKESLQRTNYKEPIASINKLVTGFELYEDLDLAKDKPEVSKLSQAEEEARKAHEKAEYLKFKKEILSKANGKQTDYSDVPE